MPNSSRGPGGNFSILGITGATVVKTGAGSLWTVSVIALGGTAGSINDSTATNQVSGGNALLTIPASAAVGTIYSMNGMPYQTGLVVTPGNGGTLAVSYV